jgi:hypothetical protein
LFIENPSESYIRIAASSYATLSENTSNSYDPLLLDSLAALFLFIISNIVAFE